MSSSTAVGHQGESANMTPSTLDLLFLTFNCAKSFVDVPVFAHHLQGAFGQNASALPELVVLSLQEAAPMAQAFIGDYMLAPYVARYDEAINLAATDYMTGKGNDDNDGSSPDEASERPYTLVRSRNVGYTIIMLFALHPERIQNVQEAVVAFGAADMGNKGAAAIRARYVAGGGTETEVTFVATHLAAMEWNLTKRNANWATIMRGLTFEDPEVVLKRLRTNDEAANNEGGSNGEGEAGEHTRLLHEEHKQQDARLRRELHDISIFKPSSHLFLGGDLNYRISTTSPPPYAAFPSLDPESSQYYPFFFSLDQLTRERNAGRTMHGMSEAEVRFPPTYKYDVLPRREDGSRDKGGLEKDVPWKFAQHRWPSWTDRVLYLDTPSWIKSKALVDGDAPPPDMGVRAYDALPLMRSSDHRPVFLRVDVPLVHPSDLAPTAEALAAASAAGATVTADPRVRLPVEIDPEAWERRAAARRREVMAGWSMFFWSTPEGAYILATLLLAGVGGYYVYRAAGV